MRAANRGTRQEAGRARLEKGHGVQLEVELGYVGQGKHEVGRPQRKSYVMVKNQKYCVGCT